MGGGGGAAVLFSCGSGFCLGGCFGVFSVGGLLGFLNSPFHVDNLQHKVLTKICSHNFSGQKHNFLYPPTYVHILTHPSLPCCSGNSPDRQLIPFREIFILLCSFANL